jgi:hypothetical protein
MKKSEWLVLRKKLISPFQLISRIIQVLFFGTIATMFFAPEFFIVVVFIIFFLCLCIKI